MNETNMNETNHEHDHFNDNFDDAHFVDGLDNQRQRLSQKQRLSQR